MTKTDIQKFRDALLSWFSKNQRDLPWRHNRDAYSIWVSEVMLQQTQVKKVIDYFNNFMSRFPTLPGLAHAELHQVLKAWEGLGYYARARNLHKAAQLIATEYSGVVPNNFADFRKLPGVGEYIASAVLSQAFGARHAVVDGNVKRVLARLYQIDFPVNSTAAQKLFAENAADLLDQASPGDFNQAMMELGATVCTPQNPRCTDCPVSKFCLSFQKETQNKYPITAKVKSVPKYIIAVGVVHKGNKILVVQRKEDGLLGGLWEFPGGKVAKTENMETACKNEIKRKTGVDVTVEKFLTTINHAYSHFKIEVFVYLCHFAGGRIRLKDHINHRWMQVDELRQLVFHKAVHKFLPAVERAGKGREKGGGRGKDKGKDRE